MSTEAALWKLMRSRDLPGHWVRVENRVGAGTPDLNFTLSLPGIGQVDGWVELKSGISLPRHVTDPVLVSHYTPQQRAWARERWKAGGLVLMLMRVDTPVHKYMLFTGDVASKVVGKAPMKLLELEAMCFWTGKWDFARLAYGIERSLNRLNASRITG